MTLPARPFPDPPAQVAPYVAILGPELTVQFLLKFGGAELYIPQSPQGKGRIEALVGREKTKQLSGAAHLLQPRVPLANEWVAACLHYQGIAISEIARQLRVTDVSVRKFLERHQARAGQSGTRS